MTGADDPDLSVALTRTTDTLRHPDILYIIHWNGYFSQPVGDTSFQSPFRMEFRMRSLLQPHFTALLLIRLEVAQSSIEIVHVPMLIIAWLSKHHKRLLNIIKLHETLVKHCEPLEKHHETLIKHHETLYFRCDELALDVATSATYAEQYRRSARLYQPVCNLIFGIKHTLWHIHTQKWPISHCAANFWICPLSLQSRRSFKQMQFKWNFLCTLWIQG